MSTDIQSALALRLAEQVRDLQQRSSDVLSSALDEMTVSAADSLPGADYAGITVVDRAGAVSSASATHPYAVLLDKIQEAHKEGPCLAAAWEHHTMRIDDLASDRRWPRYARDATDQTPIRAVLSFQLFDARTGMGALNFYAERSRAFDEKAVEVGLIYATHIAIAWNVLRVEGQFRSALASRDIIGQAKGVVMERYGIDAVHAFSLLKRLSQDTNTPLVEVAERLVNVDRRLDESHVVAR